eukprot:comp42957_c0_seq1/m.47467 comp42957_c0_seq1/g.47467  ORF comp42957_c0_seq1/g.47467 comp42957_c0_seq1/m.47467 type:complete len:194 (-) comp42957_c0_seq1:32-613(-)
MAYPFTAKHRLELELANIHSLPPVRGLEVVAKDGNVFKWVGVRKGEGNKELAKINGAIEKPSRKRTPWCACDVKFEIDFPEDYPNEPPVVTFTPPIFHMNVTPRGRMCVDFLDPNVERDEISPHGRKDFSKRGWHNTITARQILISLEEFLTSPNPEKSTNPDALCIWEMEGEKEYWRQVEECCTELAQKQGR